ncbi:hypothetical protein [Virgisporangium aurantiacum]|uniref:Excreted virulence factor EspC, type VII ESX diderm n=1 Tax=Virgisporangium aurantiacum TaxID=175570 RepID=A0A8J3ZDF2_9ACTN|nr:hypothetical protein [Virgisporangium aurantiacum]GIJ61937.1 hypothetical protein Vau01_094530 [Virgisporangium aurantiacum]
MPEIDDPVSSVPGLTAIDVDVSGLDTFAGSVEGELQANFEPQAIGLMRIYQTGSYFGMGHESPDVQAARTRYTTCLQAAVNQLAGYANATQILIEAARAVAARYRGTDALSAANLAEVQGALDQARLAAAAAVSAADRAATGKADPLATGPGQVHFE